MYCLCVNIYCTTATGCQPNCSQQIYHIISYHKIGIQWLILRQTGNKPRISVYKHLRHWSVWRVRQRHVDKIPIHRKTSDLGNVNSVETVQAFASVVFVWRVTIPSALFCARHVYWHVLFLCRFIRSSVRWDDSRSSRSPFCEVSDWFGTGERWQTIDNQHEHL